MKKFAFLIHPRDIEDVWRRFWATRFLPEKWIDIFLRRLKSGIICSRFEVFGEIEGYLVAVPIIAKQMVTLPRKIVRQRILEAILFAQNKLGVELIGLGSFIPSVTDGGRWIIRQPEVQVEITHGDSYTVAVAEEGIEKITGLCGFKREETKIAIVGAYGIIGKALTKVLAQKGYQLILIGRSRSKLKKLKEESGDKNNILISIELEDIYDADIVITATSHPGSLIRPEHLKQGVVVYDIAQPINTSPSLVKERSDILRIDGSYVNINGIELGFDMGVPRKTTFACLGETIMSAMEAEHNHHVGEIDPLHVEKTKQWAEKYGFSHAPFTCFGQPIKEINPKPISYLELKKAVS